MFSKSQYTKYRSCPKHLWLYYYKKDVLDEASPVAQKRMETGRKIGEIARAQFPGGVLIEDAWKDPQKAVARTQELIAQGVPAIYEAAFIYDNILVLVDILEKTPTGWNLVEVKSSGEKIQAIQLDDISIQNYVLSRSGLNVENCYLMHINTKYFQDTDETDWEQFFELTLADHDLLSDEEIEKDLANMRAMLTALEPTAELDKQTCKECPAKAYCWRDVPKDSVFNILRSDKARYYIAQNMPRIQDLPPDSFDNPKYNHWIEVCRTQQPYINHEAVAQWLNQMDWPLYYIDFETTQPVVPMWKYSRPYQQIPFQFSLHIQRKPNGPYEHAEYLSTGKEDPRYGCVKALLKYIGDKGTLIAHNAAFEKSRIKEMAHDLPLPQEQKGDLLRMAERFVDTADVFRKDYLHPKMYGSYSIKKVLPALVPEMSYDGMPVANGGQAQDAFDVLYAGELPPKEAQQLRTDLLAYCEQDTWAMVKLVEKLRENV